MASFEHRRVSFEVPPDWSTVIVASFHEPAPDGGMPPRVPNIAMMAEPLEPDETLRVHVDRKVAALAKKVAKLDVRETKRTDELEGRPVEHLTLRWMSPVFGTLEESLVLIGPGGSPMSPASEPRRWATIFTLTARADGVIAPPRPVFDRVLASVRFGPLLRPVPPHVVQDEALGVSFEAPAGWIDESLVTFHGHGAPAPNIVMTFERLRPGDALRVHADRKLSRLGKRARGMEILATRPSEVGGRPAVETRFGWQGRQGVVEQTLVLIDPADDPEAQVILFNLTTPPARAAQSRRLFEALLAGVRFARPPGLGPPRIAVAEPSSVKAPPTLVPMPGSPRR